MNSLTKKRKQLYQNLIADGYFRDDDGTINFSESDFCTFLGNEGVANKLYANLLKDGYFRDEEGNINFTVSSFVDYLTKADPLKEYYPITENQRGIFIDWEQHRNSIQYNTPMALRFSKEKFTAEKLVEALRSVVNAHSYIKTRLANRDEDIVQLQRNDMDAHVLFTKLTNEPEKEFFQSRVLPFDLFNDDLYRLEVYETESYIYYFQDFHHIIFDGISSGVFFLDLLSAYQGIKIQEEEVTSFDFALTEAEKKEDEGWNEARQYFDIILSDTESLVYPYSNNPDSTTSSESGHATISIKHGKAIKDYCLKTGITESNYFLSVILEIFHRVTHEENVMACFISNGRNIMDYMHTLGMFVKALPVVLRNADRKSANTFQDLANSIQSQTMSTISRDFYPFTEMVERNGIRPNVLYAYQGGLLENMNDVNDSGIEPCGTLSLNTSKFPLELYFSPSGKDEYAVAVEYDNSLYSQKDILSMLEYLADFASLAASQPELSLSHIGLKTHKEELLSLGTGEKWEYDTTEVFMDMFFRYTESQPEATAVVDYKSSITYKELDEMSNALAAKLIEAGVGHDDFIASKLPRVKEYIITAIAAWKVGAAYVPIDPEYPEDRISYMIEDSGAKLVVDEYTFHDLQPSAERINQSSPERLAYMIYTSGSTGKPKGAMISHANLRAFIEWQGRMVNMKPGDQIGEFVSFSFDASISDLYPSLANGCTLHIFSTELRRDLAGMKEYIDENHIRGMFMIPSVAVELMNNYDLSLDYLFMGGEKAVKFRPSNIKVYNAYGPTEFTNLGAIGLIDQTFPDNSIPIGRPVPNGMCAVVDADGNLVPRGIVGELALMGPQVSRGYLNRPELTAEKFMEAPFIPGQMMYRTGDLARWREDGLLDCLGRIDHQVKLRGFRIEMGEIESAVSAVEGVRIAVAAVKEINGGQHLCAYYISEDGNEVQGIRDVVAKSLTDYMIPEVFVLLDSMPLLPNGKVNRKALPDPEFKTEEIVDPENDWEKNVLDVVADVLGTNQFGVTTNLISIGLTSLRAIKLSMTLKKKLGVTISTGDILANPRIREWQETVSERIEVAAPKEYYPLTDNQFGVYIDWENNREGLQYNVPMVFKLKSVDADTLITALKKVITAHSSLKTRLSIVDGEVKQMRRNDAIISIVNEYLEEEPTRDFFQSRVRPFNLFEDDLARFEVYSTANSVYLFYDIHHLIFDGGSSNVLIPDIMKAIEGADIVPEQVSSFDYALYYNNWKNSEKYAEHEQYFDSLIEGTESFLYPESWHDDTQIKKSAVISVSVPRDEIREYAQEAGVTENAYFTVVLTQVLHRLGRQEAVQIATISNGRAMDQLSDTLGMFVQTLPLVSRKRKGTISEILADTQNQIVNTIRRDKYPYTRLAEKYAAKPNVMYAYQGEVLGNDTFGSQYLSEVIPLSLTTAKVPMSVDIVPDSTSYSIQIQYDCGLYSEHDMNLLCHALATFATSMASHKVSEDISTIDIVTDEERDMLVALGTGETMTYDEQEVFMDLFLHNVTQQPDSLAVVDSKSSLTYKQLDEMSNALAAKLIEAGVGEDDFIVARLPRVKEFMVATLAAWKVGAAYVPVDPEYPEDRINYMIEDSGAKYVVVENTFADLKPSSARINHSSPARPAYIIYTSGSTGKPKGVVVTQANLRAYIEWLGKLIDMQPGDQNAEYASFSFDASISELYPSLANGCTLHIFSSEIRRDLAAMKEYINTNHIKSTHMTPSIATELMDNYDLVLDYMLIGGEKAHRFRPSHIKVYNVYGPTEFTDITTVGLIDQTFPEVAIPLGRPVPNITCAIVDTAGRLVPRGMVGELVFIGRQMSRGYLNRPELTAERFVEAPFMPGQKMYLTGDLARWREDNQLDFLGRIDHQVKLRGFRIEMGEIESAILSLSEVRDAVAVIKEVNGTQHLCAYYVSEDGQDVTGIREEISKSLTEYMIPDVFMRLDKMPTLPNGKVDRKSLPEPEIQATAYVEPQNEIEQSIADVMKDVLGLTSPVGREDGFFALGGDSIKAIRMVSRLHMQGINLTVAQILKLQIVWKLAENVELADDSEDFSCFFDTLTVPLEESFSSSEEYESVCAEFAKKGETIERAYPLTSMQQGMLITALSAPDSSSYHITFKIELGILPTEEQLAYALGKLLSKREVLRTSIIHNGVDDPRQAIINGRNLPLAIADASAEKDIDAAIAAYKQAEFDKHIDLQWDPLFRLLCVKASEDSCHLIFTAHHVVMDGWCNALLIGDFFRFLIEAITGNDEEEDFTEYHGRYEHNVLNIISRDKEIALEYWRNLLSDYETKAEIPAYEKITDENRSEKKDINVSIPVDTSSKISKLCRENGCTISNAVEAAWGLVLQKYNRTDDAVFVKVVSGRDNTQEDMSDVVGLFINSVPIRVKTTANDTLLDIIVKCKHQAAESNEYDWVALSDIQQQSELGSNLFHSIFAYENYVSGIETDSTSSSADILKAHGMSFHEANDVEMAIAASVEKDSVILNIKFDVEKYTYSFMEGVMESFVNILTQMADTPSAKASSISLTDATHATELIALGTGPSLAYDRTETFVDQFLHHVAATPQATAVVDATSSLTFAELDNLSDALAAKLIADGVVPGDFVAVKMPRVKEFIVAVIASWKAGAAYVPVDPEYPADRITYMLTDSASRVLIDPEYCKNLSTENTAKVNKAVAENPAYMIYTSGSTGKPKGVVVTHANLRAFIAWIAPTLGLKAGDAVAHYISFSFDGGCTDLYPSIAAGGTLHILSEEVRKDVPALVAYLAENGIKGIALPTKFGLMVLEGNDLPVEYLVLGGEKNTGIRKTATRVFEMYGPTEFTVTSSFHIIDYDKDGDRIPIGRPVPNSVQVIADAYGNLVPRGMAGELCLSGSQLTNGYWQRPELTEKAFVKSTALGGATMYRTGDLARWNEQGELEYLGRIDNQVKLRGFRIELGEIESVLSGIEGITAAVAEVKTVNGIQHLVGYYVSEEAKDENMLRAVLSKSLTEYMVPDAFVHLERLPLTPVGKVDRKALPVPEFKEAEMVLPETPTEKVLYTLATKVLKNSDFGVTDDLFRFGMTSILGMRLVMMAEKHGLNFKLNDLVVHRNIRAILQQSSIMASWIKPFDPQKPVVVLVCGDHNLYHLGPYTDALSECFNVFAIDPLPYHYKTLFFGEADIIEVIEMYSLVVDVNIPENTHISAFCGHCFGGEIAYRMAQKYAKNHDNKPVVQLLDSFWHTLEYTRQTDENFYKLLPNDVIERHSDILKGFLLGGHKWDILNYVDDPTAYEGKIVYFRAAETEPMSNEFIQAFGDDAVTIFNAYMDSHPQKDICEFWRKINPSIEIQYVSSSHMNMLKQEFVHQYQTWLLDNL